ncbi:MAG: tRNA 2-thiouridine(34) synthase MnmA, partial [Spirochaetaceae bacterium]|nr:tRNA 2-thiouridine(34) synthase MnmA [Spirochaetaceae bacterium]
GNFTKQQVFEMARERGLKAAEKAESQDFVPPEFFDVIFSDVPPVPGDIVDLSGKVLGKHKGIEYYTIGQRRGLGVSANVPLYVHSIDPEKNSVVLCENDDLLKTGLIADNWVWAGGFVPTKEFRSEVKIRLASKPVMSTIIPLFEEIDGQKSAENQAENQVLPSKYKIIFDLPQRAVAPGQSAVLYLNGTILGGGLISQGINE